MAADYRPTYILYVTLNEDFKGELADKMVVDNLVINCCKIHVLLSHGI